MNFLILGENLDLDEVLVSFEERELLEKSFPGDLIVVFLHHMLRDLHTFFKLSNNNISGCQGHFSRGIHLRLSRSDDRKEVSSLLLLVDKTTFLVFENRDFARLSLDDCIKMNWVVCSPLSHSVESEEGVD